MRDVIDCPDCGGQLIREGELEDLYLCDCCGLRLEDGTYIRELDPKLKEISLQYFSEHSEEKDGVLKAWYAYHAPHFRVMPDMPLHNFTSNQRWSKCQWCGRSREEVRHDNLSGHCSKHQILPEIKDVLNEEAINFFTLTEKAKTFVPKFIEKNKISGETLAILHHTYGYEPESVAIVIDLDISPYMADYEAAMEEERARSRANQKKEIIVIKTA